MTPKISPNEATIHLLAAAVTLNTTPHRVTAADLVGDGDHLLPALERPTHMDRLTYGVAAVDRARREESDKITEYRYALRMVLLMALPEGNDTDPNAPLSAMFGQIGSVAILDLYDRLAAMLDWPESVAEVAARVRGDRPLRAALSRLHRAAVA